MLGSLVALPDRAGAAFQPAHFADILEDIRPPSYFEVRSESSMRAVGPSNRQIERLHALAPLSIHGASLSIGGGDPIDRDLLEDIRKFCKRHRPESISEQFVISTTDGSVRAGSPLAHSQAILSRVCDQIDFVQDALRLPVLLENPIIQSPLREGAITEADLLTRIVNRTGCGLLFNVNNAIASTRGQACDPHSYLDAFPLEAVCQIRLAVTPKDGSANVWPLYRETIRRLGPLPTLVACEDERTDWKSLRAEVARADAILARKFSLA
jgi:uncharacterized protein (UPF0276 family)